MSNDNPKQLTGGNPKRDQLGRFITSPEFLDRANTAVVRAVAALEAKGIKPAYIVRESRPGPAPIPIVMSDGERLALRDTVPVIERNGRAFAVRLRNIPEPYRTAFSSALYGSGQPSIESEGPCAYSQDWQDWLDGKFPR
ncbi:hypothetical protein [Paraburkholderia acidiphila]|uniref:Uncharacterized protein n=1 Tax=Paraburkholderia acidiphila TaxID=2571747 RepID=A0A7Z2G4T4_9BURK|nr:hypothetical protein [Paraburkholderia acidiphila]QGZ55076.1 hypothetical protein FAZ97_09180 [Paraburkholderia acidiphila]